MTDSKHQSAVLDFVFLDERRDPYRVRGRDGTYTIYRLTKGRQWVSLRQVKNSPELWLMQTKCIFYKHHKLYEFGVPFLQGGWPSPDAPEKVEGDEAGDSMREKTKTFYVEAPITGLVYATVEASSPEEAISKLVQAEWGVEKLKTPEQTDVSDIEIRELDIHEQVNQGNVNYCPIGKAWAEEVES